MCDHKDFKASVTVNRLEDVGGFVADVRINCAECNEPFAFLGLPRGVDLLGATTSYDGLEANLAIRPRDELDKPFDPHVRGFRVRGPREVGKEGRDA